MRKLLFTLMSLLLLSAQLIAQTRTITGTVLDNNGQPLPSVTVRVSGTNTGTTTNAQGFFSLAVPATAKSLEFSFVGFASRTVAIPTSGQIAVTLQTRDDNALNEVVVTGYSRQRRTEYSGAGSKVEAKQINQIPNGSLDQILQGRAPGLLVTAGSGQPGAAARVQIRGAGSIQGSSTPLYVMDGVPVEAAVFQSINPNDIESVDVLRDASATALYGNRGSAGVIVITTKKGRSGTTTFNYSGQTGITQPGTQRFEMMNSDELLRFQEILGSQQAVGLPGWTLSPRNPANAALTPAQQATNARQLDSLRNINTNWADIFQRQGSFNQHDISLSGGAGRTRFFSSFGLYNEQGIGLRSDMRRYSFRTNIDHQTDKFTASLNAFAGLTNRNFLESENSITLANPFAAAYLALPYHQLNQVNGRGAFHQITNPGFINRGALTGPNAYDRMLETDSRNTQIKSTINLQANYQVTKNFNVGAFAGIDFRETVSERQIKPFTWSARAAGFPTGPRQTPSTAGNTDTLARGSWGEGRDAFFSYIVRGNIGYRNSFGTKHDVDVQTFVEYTRDRNRSFSYTGFGINDALLGTPAGITPGNTTNQLIATLGGGRTERSLMGFLTTARYTFDKRFTANLSFRRDATSQLPIDNRWQNFYSAGITWNAMREKFVEKWTAVSDLRVRLSYGTSANADNFVFGNFGYLPQFAPVNYIGGGTVQGLVPTNPGNPDVIWERKTIANLGIDFGFFRNRITGSIDIYQNQTVDNIINQNLPLESGFRAQPVNAGTLRNRGAELQINADVVRVRDFTWSVGGNIAYNDNRIISLNQVNQFEQGTSLVKVGLPLGSHYVVRWAGVDAATGAPLYYDSSGNVTTVFSDNNRVANFGTFNAPWIGGFNSAIQFKGFRIEAFFTFQQGFSRFNNQSFFQLNHAFALQGFNLNREMLTMWQRPGDVTNIQSSLYQRQFSSKDIEDASFLRFRNLNISYDFGQTVAQKLRIFRGIRVFAQAQNLYTWTKWTGFDPEDNNNIGAYEYPTPRTFTVGVNLNFK